MIAHRSDVLLEFLGFYVRVLQAGSPPPLQMQVQGYTAVQNVRGTTFLEIIGINPKNITHYIIVLDCMYLIFLLLAFALLYLRMPQASRLRPTARRL